MNQCTERAHNFTCTKCGDNIWIVSPGGGLKCVACGAEK